MSESTAGRDSAREWEDWPQSEPGHGLMREKMSEKKSGNRHPEWRAKIGGLNEHETGLAAASGPAAESPRRHPSLSGDLCKNP
jgi:hypothetical protein